MRTEYFLRQVRRLMTGHAIPAISTEDLAKVLVPVPSIEVQKKISEEIATILSMRREALKAGEKVVKDCFSNQQSGLVIITIGNLRSKATAWQIQGKERFSDATQEG